MSKYSPTVLPAEDTGLRDFGRAVAAAIQGIRQRKRQKKEDARADAREQRDVAAAERDRLRDDVDLYNAGYRSGPPPADEPDVRQRAEAAAEAQAEVRGGRAPRRSAVTAQRLQELDRTERAVLRMSIKTLEARADASTKVVVSSRFARQVARYLRRLLEEPSSGSQ